MYSKYFDNLLTSNASWGLVDKRRAQAVLLLSNLLIVYLLASIGLWLFSGGAITSMAIVVFVVMFLLAIFPIANLFVHHSLWNTTMILIGTQFVVVNLLIAFSGFVASPMLLNLIYIPMIAFLPGDSRLVIYTALVCLAMIVLHLVLGNFYNDIIISEILAGDYWFQWNLVACITLSSVLALSYANTVREVSDLVLEEVSESRENVLHDELTGLANERMLARYSESLIYRSKKLNQTFAMVMVNIKEFSRFNAEYGYEKGDQALLLLASRLISNVRGNDIVSRVENDHFVIVLVNIQEPDNAKAFVEKLYRVLSESLVIDQKEVNFSFDIGAVTYPLNGDTMDILLESLAKVMGEKNLQEVINVS